MTGGRGRGRGSGGFRGANRGRGGFNSEARPQAKENGLQALTGGTIARRGSGRGNSSGAGARGRGGNNGPSGARKGQEHTPEPDGYDGIRYSPKHALQSGDPLNSTPYQRHEHEKRLAYLKHAQAFKKQEQIAKGQLDPDGQMDLNLSVDKHGLCEDLCPELERVRRIVQNDVAGPEYSKETAHGPRNQRQVDEARMIAAHHRSAAGDDLTLMSDLRTPSALHKSMVAMIMRLKGDQFEFLNGWIWDRSRAVRVEINKNYHRREDTEAFLSCYEMCIRFHLLSMHQMSKSTSNDYDRQTDWQQLSAACYQIKELWEKIGVYVPEDGVSACPIEPSRVAEIHAYNIILGLKEPEHREEVRRNPRVTTAQALVRAAQNTKDSATFWRLCRSSAVSYLMACAAATRFMSVRSDTLSAMVKGYMVHKQKVDDWTLEKLARKLGFDNDEQVRTYCQGYGGEFDTNAEGETYLKPETITLRKDPFEKKQFFSGEYVESKRAGRNLAAVLLGYNLSKANDKGLMDQIPEPFTDPTSLFIPQTSVPSAPSNPFAMAAAARTPAQPSGLFPSSIQPGLFDPSKNSVKFALQPNDGPSSTPAPGNPFASAAAKLNANGQPATPPTGFSASPTSSNAGLSAQAKPFTAFGSSNSFANSTGQNASKASAAGNGVGTFTPAGSFTSPWNAFSEPSNPGSSTKTSTPFSAFAASGGASTPSVGLGAFATGSSTPNPTEATTTDSAEEEQRKKAEEEQRKAEEAQRKAKEEEEQRKAQEEQRRAAEEQRRKAEEEQRRKAEEEQAKARVAEQQRRVREEKERERLRIQQEEARLAEEQRRLAEEQRKQALETLATNLFEDPRNGLMKQYLAHVVETMFNDTKAALLKEREAEDEALAYEMGQRKKQSLVRAAFYRWAQYVHKKRRAVEARSIRDRRRKLKAEVQLAKSSRASSAVSPPAPAVQAIDEPLTTSVDSRTNGSNNVAPGESRATNQQPDQPDQRNGEFLTPSIPDFSQSYHEARKKLNRKRGTIDRTETDYFRLRAMGIDPNKLRKRSHDSSDEEDAQADSKRARTSSSSGAQVALADFRKSLPPPSTDEERMARFHAIKASLYKSGHSQGHAPSRSFDLGSSRTSTFNTSTTSQIIQRARETLARVSPSGQSTPDRAFARSTGTPLPDDKPAYWARQSRFVPQHLYGQPEAIRVYRAQMSDRRAGSSQMSPDAGLQFHSLSPSKDIAELPGFLSSPISTQQSYFPTQPQQQRVSVAKEVLVLEDDAEDEDDGDGDDDDGFDEYDEEGEPDQEEDVDIEEDEDEEQEGFYSEDETGGEGGEEDSEMDDEEESLQFAQKTGGTEDDAIELSD